MFVYHVFVCYMAMFTPIKDWLDLTWSTILFPRKPNHIIWQIVQIFSESNISIISSNRMREIPLVVNCLFRSLEKIKTYSLTLYKNIIQSCLNSLDADQICLTFGYTLSNYKTDSLSEATGQANLVRINAV